MPQILVVADKPPGSKTAVVYREPVSLDDLDSADFSHQLTERVGWAVVFADQLENGNGPVVAGADLNG